MKYIQIYSFRMRKYINDKNVFIEALQPNSLSKTFIYSSEAAKNLEFLKSIGITHLLNAAQGNDFLMTVNTNADYYKDSGIKYLGLELIDFCSVSISPYIQQAADFIEEGLDSGGNKYCYNFKTVVFFFIHPYFSNYRRQSSCSLCYGNIEIKYLCNSLFND